MGVGYYFCNINILKNQGVYDDILVTSLLMALVEQNNLDKTSQRKEERNNDIN